MKKNILLSLLLVCAVMFAASCDSSGGGGSSEPADTTTTTDSSSTADGDSSTTTETSVPGEIKIVYDLEGSTYSSTVFNNSTCNLENVLVGTSKTVTFTISNESSAYGLTLESIPTISGTDAGQFSINTDSLKMDIDPSGSTSFTVSFTPSSLGTKNATLEIKSNDTNESVTTVLLQGKGSTANVVDSGTSSSFGDYNSVAIDASGAIYVAYNGSTAYDNFSLMLAKSTDSGKTWTTKTIDDSADEVGKYISLAITSSAIYICYTDATNYDLKFAKSTDSGSTFTKSVIADGGFLYTDMHVVPDTSDGDDIYIASGGDVHLSLSTDGGVSWTTNDIVGGDLSLSDVIFDVSLAVDSTGRIVYAFWNYTDDRYVLMNSTDNGSNWSSVISSIGGLGDMADIAIGTGNNVYSICQYGQSDELIFFQSSDSGVSWTGGTAIADNTDGASMAVDSNGTIYIANSDSGLQLMKSTDNGATWQTYEIDKDAGSGVALYIDSSNNLYVSYSTGGSVKFAMSTDGGVTW